jgi:hypothetical protein
MELVLRIHRGGTVPALVCALLATALANLPQVAQAHPVVTSPDDAINILLHFSQGENLNSYAPNPSNTDRSRPKESESER